MTLSRKSPMNRGTKGLSRGPSTLRRTKLRARNPERQAATFQRAYGGADRADWMTRQPCLVCGALPSVNAHVGPKGSKGAGYKSDARWTVPLCPMHHDEQHHGPQTFEATYGLDLESLAHIYDARFEQECAASTPSLSVSNG